ncbi:3-oxoacyl-[acyl-carrier-protein] synthase III C-terminal domain-containing protein [Loktanella agnita]|uniref:3-oxoacyl-[acyl-carrier-protein] synthase III C-terminal domain-containing protein n=1 Tax=Loktanella agnita TaxID=287097 RepID=UPI0039896C6D
MRLLGLGSYLPREKRPSDGFDAAFSLPAGRVMALTGVRNRHYCSGDESQITMGIAAAKAALADAGVQPGDIDLVVGASAVPYQPIPATAPLYQRGLGIADGAAYAFDVNSTCLSFVSALEVCAGLLASGRYRRALIVSSEVASRGLPWAERPDVAGLFGDGAAAAVVEHTPGAMVTRFRTYPGAYESCGIGAGGTRFDFHAEAADFAAHSRFDMDGKELFRVTAKHFVPFVDGLLADVGWHRDEIDLIVPHQASPLALARMIRQCGFDPARVVDICSDVGNQIAASIPFSLTHAQDRLRRGDKVLMLGTSAGVSFGGAALVY